MWKCYQQDPTEGWVYRGEIDLPADCFGDELYDYMVKRGWIESIDDYDVEGNNDIVHVVGKETKFGKFMWEFSNTKKASKKKGN